MTPVQNATSGQTMGINEYIDSLAKSGSSTDIAFMVFQEQVKGLNQQVKDALQDVQTSGRIRDAYAKKLAALRDLKDLAAQVSKDDKAKVSLRQLYHQYWKNKGKDINLGDGSPKEMWDEFRSKFDPAQQEPRVDDKGNVLMERDKEQKMTSVSGNILQSRIDTVKDNVRKIDSQREIGMIMLNTWMNKKGNAISQLTNLIKAQHDTAKSVINHLAV